MRNKSAGGDRPKKEARHFEPREPPELLHYFELHARLAIGKKNESTEYVLEEEKKRVTKRRRTYDVDALLAALFVLCILHIRSFPMLHDDAVSTQDGSPHPPSSTLTTRRALHPSLAAPSGVQPAAVRRMSATFLSKMHGRQAGSRREAADASAFLHFRRPSPPSCTFPTLSLLVAFLHLLAAAVQRGTSGPLCTSCLYGVRRTGKVDDVWVWAVVGACPL